MEIGDTCYSTFPCKHYVTMNGRSKLIFGTDIVKLCLKNDIPIPQHFVPYIDHLKHLNNYDLIDQDDLENFIKNYQPHYAADYLAHAIGSNRPLFVKYLIDRGTKINGDCVIQSTKNLHMFFLAAAGL